MQYVSYKNTNGNVKNVILLHAYCGKQADGTTRCLSISVSASIPSATMKEKNWMEIHMCVANPRK